MKSLVLENNPSFSVAGVLVGSATLINRWQNMNALQIIWMKCNNLIYMALQCEHHPDFGILILCNFFCYIEAES